jgi:hypothetical protein
MSALRWANQYGRKGGSRSRLQHALVNPVSLDIDLVRQAGLPPTWDGHGALEEWEMVANSHNTGIRMRAAAHPDCPPQLLEQLAADPNQWVAQQAVTQPSASSAVLERGAAHAHPLVRLAVTQHPVCPPSLGRRLIDDPDPEVRQAAIDRWGLV